MCWRKSNIKTVSLVELENRNKEIIELKSKIDELSKKDTNHVADITKLNNTNLELNVNNTKLLTKIKELNHELEQYKVVNEALTDKVNEFNTDNHDKQILIDEMTKRYNLELDKLNTQLKSYKSIKVNKNFELSETL